MKAFKSMSCTSSSDDFIQCKISFMLGSLLFLLLSVQSFCIIHEDRFLEHKESQDWEGGHLLCPSAQRKEGRKDYTYAIFDPL